MCFRPGFHFYCPQYPALATWARLEDTGHGAAAGGKGEGEGGRYSIDWGKLGQ